MRLIDADRMKTTHEIQMGDFNSMESIGKWIDRQPTAYDVEAVLAELDDYEMWREVLIYPLDYRERTILKKVVEIVKRGGRNDCV